jgi:hypothetical protein
MTITELLEQGLKYLYKAYKANNDKDSVVVMGHLNIVEISIKTALKHARTELTTSRWYTPEQWEKRTGKKWPEDWPVWSITTDGLLTISTMGEEEIRKTWGTHIYVIATEAGPPPDDWRPEEE